MSDVANTVVAEKEDLPIAPTEPTKDDAKEAEPKVETVDDQELAEAEAALAVEEAGEEGDPAGAKKPPEGAADPTPEPTVTEPVVEPAVPAEETKTAAPTIPKGRLDEALARGDKEAMNAVYWKGQADAFAVAAKGPGQAAPGEPAAPVKTPQEQIVDVRAEKVALAEKFDNGEFTAPEWETQRQVLDDQEAQIRADAQPRPAPVAAPAAVPTTAAIRDDLRLEELTDEISTEHPYVALIGEHDSSPVAAHRWETLEKEAGISLQAQGVVFQRQADGTFPARQLLILREEVAKLTDVYGPLWFPDADLPDPTTPADVTPAAGADGGEPALTPRQKARLNKLTLAGGQPPDTTAVGGTGTTREYTDADIVAMSEEELEALPESLKRKFDPEFST